MQKWVDVSTIYVWHFPNFTLFLTSGSKNPLMELPTPVSNYLFWGHHSLATF